MSSLDVSDIETLQAVGHDTIQSIVALCVEAVMWTIYLTLVVMAGRILLRKSRSNISIFNFCIILTMFFMDTAMFIIDVNNTIKEISYTLTSDSDLSLADRYSLTENLPWPVEAALYAFMSNLGDVIVIWRVYAFYSKDNERWALALPLTLLLGSFTTSGLISYCAAQGIRNSQGGNFVAPFCKNVQLSSYYTTLATTGVATLMIAYKTWQYRRRVGRHLRTTNRAIRVERLMYIVIESGVLYFLFFLEAVVSDSGNVGNLESSTPALQFANTVWTYMTSHILGIYPVIIVILVHSQKSYIDTTAAYSGSHPIQGSGYTGSANTRPPWDSSHTAFSTRKRTQPIEVNVHELRELHGTVSSKAIIDDGTGDTVVVLGEQPGDGKFTHDIA